MPQTDRARGIVRLVIETERGNITVALDSAHAPVSVANFLRYVDRGLYDGGRFHRAVTAANQPNDSVRIEVIASAGHWVHADQPETFITRVRHALQPDSRRSAAAQTH